MQKNLFLFLAPLALTACEQVPFWPTNDGAVTGSLSAATLADNCTGSAITDSSSGIGKRAVCRPSSIQLSFRSSSRSPSKVAIKAVRAINLTSGAVRTYAHSAPRQWQTGSYVVWDEQLLAGSNLQVSYTINQLALETVPSYARVRARDMYRVEVDVEIRGLVRTLTIEAQLEPEVVT
jgi:hypothetical protein